MVRDDHDDDVVPVGAPNKRHCCCKQEEKSISSSVLRHLEKRRTSTCRFADRVARVALDEYRKRIPLEHQQPATCIAAILAHDDQDQQLHVLGLGVGTKFLTIETLLQESTTDSHPNDNNNSIGSVYGRRVRDCHAEVLARRAFRRQILWMIYQDLQQQQKDQSQQPPLQHDDNQASESILQADDVVVDSGEPKPFATKKNVGLSNLLRRVTVTTPSLGNPLLQPHHDRNSQLSPHPFRYALRPGVTLHMYTSTAPCGNATLKKFAKMEKERFIEHLGDNEWPTTPHPVVSPHSWKLGQFSLLLKRDNLVANSSSVAANNFPGADTITSTTTSNGVVASMTNSNDKNNKTTESNNLLLEQQACPPGTCLVSSERGVVHTCSDKICRWNCLGLQGSLLFSLLDEPLYLSTLTVGRKLTACICRRAVCCRIGKDDSTGKGIVRWPNQQQQQQYQDQSLSPFRLVHPAVLGTSVYVDEDAAIETSQNDGTKGQDVRFHSSQCWAWWPGKEMEECKDDPYANGTCAVAECINGTTGFCAEPMALAAERAHATSLDHDDVVVVSKVSTAALLQLYLDISVLDDHNDDARQAGDECNCKTLKQQQQQQQHRVSSLTDLLAFKQQVAPLYEAAKDELLGRHPVLRNWKRRHGFIAKQQHVQVPP